MFPGYFNISVFTGHIPHLQGAEHNIIFRLNLTINYSANDPEVKL